MTDLPPQTGGLTLRAMTSDPRRGISWATAGPENPRATARQ